MTQRKPRELIDADGRLIEYCVEVMEAKTKKIKVVELNQPTSSALRAHLETSTGRFLFEGQRGNPQDLRPTTP